MRIIYNPKDGGPITQWIFEGKKKLPHFPDGFEMKDGKIAHGLMQYTDLEAVEILETYEFLRQVTVAEAKEIIDRPAAAAYKCEYPGCEFASKAKIGLEGHKRSHKASAEDQKPALDPSIIPVSTGQRVQTPADIQKENDPMREWETRNGHDLDGVEWYGEGVQVDNQNADSFGGQRRPGRGHFVG